MAISGWEHPRQLALPQNNALLSTKQVFIVARRPRRTQDLYPLTNHETSRRKRHKLNPPVLLIFNRFPTQIRIHTETYIIYL